MAIEGIDGTGKSTALNNVQSMLIEQGLNVTTVRYTNKSGFMGQVVNMFYGKGDKHPLIDKVGGFRPFQAGLYATNGRVNLLNREHGADVLLADRSVVAGFASHIGRVPMWWVSAVESRCVPDVVAYLELPLGQATDRLRVREGTELGHEEDMESQIQFRDDYEKVFANPPVRLKDTTIERIDASQSELVVAQSIANLVFTRLGIEPIP